MLKPSAPVEPIKPVAPVSPINPVSPVAPVTPPLGPTGPVAPVAPVILKPVAPVIPVTPVSPVAPAGIVCHVGSKPAPSEVKTFPTLPTVEICCMLAVGVVPPAKREYGVKVVRPDPPPATIAVPAKSIKIPVLGAGSPVVVQPLVALIITIDGIVPFPERPVII